MEIRVRPDGPLQCLNTDMHYSDALVERASNIGEYLSSMREEREAELGLALIAYLRAHPLAIVRFDDWEKQVTTGPVKREAAHLHVYPLAEVRRVGDE